MSGRRNTRKTLEVLIGLTILGVVAIVAVNQLRSPSPGAGPTTLPDSTTTTVVTPTTAQAATTTIPSIAIESRGQLFSWSAGLNVADQTPVALLEHDGSVWLFTGTPSAEDAQSGPTTGLQTWVSTDGTDWELRSVIEDEFEVNTVISSSFGLIAAGFDPASGDGVVWQSVDGSTWSRSVASPAQNPRFIEVVSAVASEGLVFIHTEEQQSRAAFRNAIERALTDSGHLFEGFLPWYEGTSSWVIVQGPFGVHTATVPFTDIGLTRAEVEGTGGEASTTAWVTTDGSNWSEHPQPAHMRSIFVGLDGTVLSQIPVSATDNRLSTRALDPADMVWHEVGPATPAEVKSQWPGGFLGQFPNEAGQVSVSADGLSWRNLSPRTLLPREVGWDFHALGGGEQGIAMIGTAVTPPPEVETETVEWEQDGYTIVVDQDAFEVLEDGISILRVLRWGADDTQPDGHWDPAVGTLELLHPDTGESVVTLDIADVSQRLPNEGNPAPSSQRGTVIGQAFLFSHSETWPVPGVVTTEQGIDVWTVQDFWTVAPERAIRLLVTSSHVIVATSGGGGTVVVVGSIPGPP